MMNLSKELTFEDKYVLGGEHMKKKILTVLLAATMVFSMVGCGGKSGDSDLIKVGIINNDPNESGYRTANVNDLKNMFTETNGYDADFRYSNDNATQIADAQKMIQDGVQYLLISAANVSGWDTVLKDAQKQGVKVILFDRTIEADDSLYEASIVSDMNKEGQMAVDWLASQGLSEYKIVHIQGEMGTAAQVGRTKALQEKADGDAAWELVVQQTGKWSDQEAEKIVTTAINQGLKFNVIYAENDNMAQGAAKALDNAGIKHGVGQDVIIMGFDCNKWALQELKAGNWNYDGQCNPFQAAELDKIIKKLEKGEKLDQKVVIMEEKGFDAKTITDEDIERYGI